VARGSLSRRGACDEGGSAASVLADMENLMDQSLASPLDPARLDAVAASLGYADGQSLYSSR